MFNKVKVIKAFGFKFERIGDENKYAVLCDRCESCVIDGRLVHEYDCPTEALMTDIEDLSELDDQRDLNDLVKLIA